MCIKRTMTMVNMIVPIALNQIPAQPVGTVLKTNTDAQATTKDAEDNNIKSLSLPRVLGTAIKIETPANKRKTQTKTESVQNCGI